jgi:release factor glutamine methyltransferase
MITETKQTIHTCLQSGIKFLKSRSILDARLSAEAILSKLLHVSRAFLYTEDTFEISNEITSEFESQIEKRARYYPLQYLLKEAPFRNLTLSVRPGCLIPRPETEGLVDVVLNALQVHFAPKVLDVGTGSGNIAISLASERPTWKIIATDISDEALQIAEKNARNACVQEQITFIQTDLWDGVDQMVDALISNPPYLTETELRDAQPELSFEPKRALFGGQDGLLFYRRMILKARTILKKNGFIFFEMGLGQAVSVCDLLSRTQFSQIQIYKDRAGIDRIVSARTN